MKYGFIQRQGQRHAIGHLCRVLGVSRSGYYAWYQRVPSRRAEGDQALGQELRRAHAKTREAYGTVRMWRYLNRQGHACGKHRVRRLRGLLHLEVRRVRRFRVTTESRHSHAVAPNRLAQQFAVPLPNRVWGGDMTFIATAQGWLYLAVVLDLCARRVVGWSMRERLDQVLVLEALRMAIGRRQPPRGLLHHSDQGRQYAGGEYQRLLSRHGMVASMSRKGNCYDNACVESFFSTLKNELVLGRTYRNRDEARREVFDYIETFYNTRRLHQSLGYVSPVQFERQFGMA